MLKSRFYEKFLKYLPLIGGVATLGIVIPFVILAYAQNNVGSIHSACNNNDPKCNPPTTQPSCLLPDFLLPSRKETVVQLITPRQKIYFPLKGCGNLDSVDIYIKGTKTKLPAVKNFDKSTVVITLESCLESNKDYEVVIKARERGYFRVMSQQIVNSKSEKERELEKYQNEQDHQSCNNQ